MKARKLLMIGIGLSLTLLFSGCVGSKIIIRPIRDVDIIMLEKDQDFKVPERGVYFTDLYVKEVLDAKIEE